MKKNWKIVKIPEVLFFQEGPGVRKNQFSTNGVKLLNVGNINEERINLSKTKIYISKEEAFGKYKHFLIDEGDLVIASSGIVVDNFYNKIAFIEKEHLPLCMNTSTIRFKALDKKVLNLRYFKFFLKTKFFSNQLQKLITGSAQLNFGPSHLKKIDLILPPLQDQKRIVKILDSAEALCQKRKQVITLLDNYLKSVFLEMFGDPVTNTKKIKTYRGSDLFKFSSGKFNPTKNLSDGFKYPTYGGNGITGYSKDYLIDYDTLAIGRVGAYCGCIHKTSGKIWITDNAIFVKDFKQEVNLEFMNFQFKFLKFNKFADFSGQPKITQKPLEKTEYLAPPLEAQKIFDEIVKKTESIKQKMLIQSQELETQFQALIQKAFKGEL